MSEVNRLKILHLSNDFSGSTVYKNLVGELDKLRILQVVYNPIKESNRIGKNIIDFETGGSFIIYSHILNKTIDRIFYKQKINKIVRDIEGKLDLSDVSCIHSHTWYSDGGVAYELFKRYHIPYIVTIRGSDLWAFFRYMIHLRSYGLDILNNAKKIIFISPVYFRRFNSHPYVVNCKSDFSSKSVVFPNGIDRFWIDNSLPSKRESLNCPLQVLFIGRLIKIKNSINLAKAILRLNNNGYPCHLHIVGEKGSEYPKLKELIWDNRLFTYHGSIYDMNKLQNLYRMCDIFAMPSKNETFGLVYIEALSQGLPVLYSKDEGIDGLYDNVGEAVDSNSVKDISDGIATIARNYSSYIFDPAYIVSNHNWETIAKKYLCIYDAVRKNAAY